MSTGVTIRLIYSRVPEAIGRILNTVGEDPALNRTLSVGIANLTKSHIRTAAASRHSTILRLGAAPTGHLTDAADSVRADDSGNEIAAYVDSPGFRRVDGPITIKPRNAKALTIPVHALGYGRRASSVEHLVGKKLFAPKDKSGKSTGVLGYSDSNGVFRAIYVLKARVTLPQDRGLLPTDEEYQTRLVSSLRTFLKTKINTGAAQ